MKCEDCGTTKRIVGDLKGTLCVDCMNKRSSEHFRYLVREEENKEIAKAIHWPECWDTAVYPTLALALWELIENNFDICPTCGKKQGLEKTSLREELIKRGQLSPKIDAQLKEIEKGE